MFRPRLLTLTLSLVIAAAAAAPAQAAVHRKYRFTFSGANALRAATTPPALKATWEWPVNKFNRNRRDTGDFAVLSGSGCGTRPDNARWKIREKSGTLPAQSLIIDFVHNPDQKNPAPVVDSQYAGEPPADIKFTLRFPSTGKTLTMLAKPHGDIANFQFSPATTTISRKRVTHC